MHYSQNGKLKVGVFMGGLSAEREVSFNSGRTICDHLDTTIYDIIPIFQTIDRLIYILPWRFIHRGKISDFESRLKNEALKIEWDNLKEHIDFVYIAAHGQYAEDGRLQGMLEILQIPYLGSKVFASAIGMDKNMQKIVLKSNGINIPNSITINNNSLEEILDNLKENNLNFPLIVKPNNEGSSLGISLVKSEDKLLEAVEKAANINIKKQPVIIEEFIDGIEFTCIVITDLNTSELCTNKLFAMPITQIIKENNSDFFDYEQKYMPGRATKITPAKINPEIETKIKETCIKTMKILNMENIGRFDGFINTNGEVVIIDPNSLAGMSPSSFLFMQAAQINISHTEFINHLIKTELKNYNINTESFSNMAPSSELFTNKKISANKIAVAVILGGNSNEKEISLESGRNVFYKLSPEKYNAIALFLDSNLKLYKIDQNLLVKSSTKEIEDSLNPSMHVKWQDLPKTIDFAFLALHGGVGENGSIQGTLEMLGVPYNGSSVLTSALCMNKYKTTQFLKAKQFDVPNGILIKSGDSLDELNLEFPLIVKPNDDGCSVMVSKVYNKEELQQSISNIFANNKAEVLIEECIIGTELTVGVIGNNKNNIQAFPASKVITSKDILSIEEKFLPGAGENQTPAPLSASVSAFIKKTIEEVYLSLNCKGYSRIDCFYQEKTNKLIIIECNTLPGLTPATCLFHQAAEINIKPMELIDLIIQFGLQEHEFIQNNLTQTTKHNIIL